MGQDLFAGGRAVAAKHLPHAGNRVDAEVVDRGPRLADEFRHLEIDQLVEDRPACLDALAPSMKNGHAGCGVGHQRQFQQFVECHESQLHGVVGVVSVVSDRVGGIDDLRLEQWGRRGAVLLAGRLRIEHLAGEVETGEVGVARLEQLHDP